MANWAIRCGNCGLGVAADVVAGWPPGIDQTNKEGVTGRTLWLLCPECQEGSVKLKDGSVFPSAPAGASVAGLPGDVAQAWREVRTTHAVAAYTASEIMCRKILMHIAVDKASAKEGKTFVEYVDALDKAGFIAPGLKPVVDIVRTRGNGANHELPASNEQDSIRTLKITEHLLHTMYELPSLAPPDPEPAE